MIYCDLQVKGLQLGNEVLTTPEKKISELRDSLFMPLKEHVKALCQHLEDYSYKNNTPVEKLSII